MKSCFSKNNGFTLIEYIIVIVVMGVISSVLAVVVLGGVRAFNAVVVQEELIAGAETTLEILSREIRNSSGPAGVFSAGSEIFSFKDVHGKDISYYSGGGFIMRNGAKAAGNPGRVEFIYLDARGETLQTPVAPEYLNNIKLIQIELLLSSGERNVKLSSLVRPRNF